MRDFVPDSTTASWTTIHRIRATAVIVLLPLLLAGCAPRYLQKDATTAAEQDGRAAIVAYARSLLGLSDLRGINKNFKNDCSGFVNGVYAMKGRKIAYTKFRKDRSLSESLYLTLEDRNLVFKERMPDVADAVFFRNTYETAFSGITHVGLVEQVGGDGTVTILHYASGKVARIVMNLRHPGQRADGDGRAINDYVRKDSGGAPRRDYLAGNLFYSYGDIYRYTEK